MTTAISARSTRCVLVVLAALVLAGCDDDGSSNQGPSDTTPMGDTTPTDDTEPVDDTVTDTGGGDDFEENVDIAVCAPDAGGFSADIAHPFFLHPVGQVLVLEGEEDGATIRVEITSLDETEDVAGVTTRVIEERESEDGELVEVSRNFFATAADGTVCYFGEDVDDYEDGMIVGHEGAWRAGDDGALPGIIMPADPVVGQAYRQEVAPGVAEDRAVHTSSADAVTVPAGTYTDTLTVDEDSAIEPTATSRKVYARDVGLIVDDELELLEIQAP